MVDEVDDTGSWWLNKPVDDVFWTTMIYGMFRWLIRFVILVPNDY